MATQRAFARFSRWSKPPVTAEVPDGGFCLSAFLVISKQNDPRKVLMGRIDPTFPWEEIGALDRDRAERAAAGFTLPSSHLILGESPLQAAKRILKEQLGMEDIGLTGPSVFSEVYGDRNHWDIEFVFFGAVDSVRKHPAWRELTFVDLVRMKKEDFARSHQDVLSNAGLWKDTESATDTQPNQA
jgi:ADP-ribose pyrophosphatase YjhB (NUDIX family)